MLLFFNASFVRKLQVFLKSHYEFTMQFFPALR